jgi:hypothetical protein
MGTSVMGKRVIGKCVIACSTGNATVSGELQPPRVKRKPPQWAACLSPVLTARKEEMQQMDEEMYHTGGHYDRCAAPDG